MLQVGEGVNNRGEGGVSLSEYGTFIHTISFLPKRVIVHLILVQFSTISITFAHLGVMFSHKSLDLIYRLIIFFSRKNRTLIHFYE